MDYSYEINPCMADTGLGWELRMLKGGAEVAKLIFPVNAEGGDIGGALQTAYLDAMFEAKDWLRSKKTFTVKKAAPLHIFGVLCLPLLLLVLAVALLTLLAPSVYDLFRK